MLSTESQMYFYVCDIITMPKSFSAALTLRSTPHPPRLLPQVQAEIRRKWRRWRLERFLGADVKYQHPTNGSNFATQISMLTRCSPKTPRASACQDELIWHDILLQLTSVTTGIQVNRAQGEWGTTTDRKDDHLRAACIRKAHPADFVMLADTFEHLNTVLCQLHRSHFQQCVKPPVNYSPHFTCISF